MTPKRTVFMEVVSWGDKGFLTEWYKDELDDEGKAEFDSLLITLAAAPRLSWSMPDFKPLGGGICELRFPASKKAYRPLGYDGPSPNQFTILVGAYKKMRQWTPRDAQRTAAKRRREVATGARKVRKYAEHLFTDV